MYSFSMIIPYPIFNHTFLAEIFGQIQFYLKKGEHQFDKLLLFVTFLV
jgi:hypothetical protein